MVIVCTAEISLVCHLLALLSWDAGYVGSVGIAAQDWLELFSSFSLTDANNSATTLEHQEALHTCNAQGDPSKV